MVAKIGKKLIQGAKEELQKDPPKLIDTTNMTDLIEGFLTLGLLTVMIFGVTKHPKQPVTVIVNNYVNGVLQ